jgi:hypothetical protein
LKKSKLSLMSIGAAVIYLFWFILLPNSFAFNGPGPIASTQQPIQPSIASSGMLAQSLSSMPLAFTINKGQWPDSIGFRANSGGTTMWFTPGGAYYQFTRRVESKDEARRSDLVGRDRGSFGNSTDSIETMLIKASFVGCNQNRQLSGDNLLEYKCNFFLGNDTSTWQADVPNYGAVTYKEVYSGIDLKYYGDGRNMEYDFIVAPGADYSQIKINYEGAKSLALNESGDLVIQTGWGTVTEKAPLVYQVDGQDRTLIKASYMLGETGSFGFALGQAYNPSLSLVIDPVLSYSSYLGGSGDDNGIGIAVDRVGSVFVTGWSEATDFPTFSPINGSLNGARDVFVSKMNPAGNGILYSTYLGGSGLDFAYGIAVDSLGSAYVTGWTNSSDFPTASPFDASFGGGPEDVFVAKLSPSGNSLAYSTYLGGSGNEEGYDIKVDKSGSAYVTGATNSTDFPTVSPFDGGLSGTTNAFVTKLSPTGSSLVYSSYLGGSINDYGERIAIDGSGNAYLTGRTESSDFPTVSPFHVSLGGSVDAFVTKVNPAGSNLVYSTYLGGSGQEFGYGIAVDSFGSAYLTGWTSSTDFPTANPLHGSLGGGPEDVFVTKLSPNGNSLVYSTYMAGSSNEEGYDIAVDLTGSAYVIGSTHSSNFPTVSPIDGTLNGTTDAFAFRLSPTGSSLVYSTYLGGSNDDYAWTIALDTAGSAYLTGSTKSPDFPTASPFDGSWNGGWDAYVIKLKGGCCTGTSGNVNLAGGVDLADLSALVSYLTGGGYLLTCIPEANVNGSGAVDLADLSALVSYLTGGGYVLPSCS